MLTRYFPFIITAEKTDKENMVKFLRSWRKEQLEKIEDELKRLHSIENYIENVDKDNFVPFLDEKQLDVLVAAKVSSQQQQQQQQQKSSSKNEPKPKQTKTKPKRYSEEKVPVARKSTTGYN